MLSNRMFWLLYFFLAVLSALDVLDIGLSAMLIVILLNATYATFLTVKRIFLAGGDIRHLIVTLCFAWLAFGVMIEQYVTDFSLFDAVATAALTIIGFFSGVRIDRIAIVDIFILPLLMAIPGFSFASHPLAVAFFALILAIPFILRAAGVNRFGLGLDVILEIQLQKMLLIAAVSVFYVLVIFYLPPIALPLSLSYLALARMLEKE